MTLQLKMHLSLKRTRGHVMHLSCRVSVHSIVFPTTTKYKKEKKKIDKTRFVPSLGHKYTHKEMHKMTK